MARNQAKRASNNTKRTNNMYVYGNVVSKPVFEPSITPEMPAHEDKNKERKKSNRTVRQNRRREKQMNAGYVFFLAVASIITMIVCVSYIQVQASVTKGTSEITSMQKELYDLKEANNAKESSVRNSVNLEQVRDKAVNELGLTYVTDGQIIAYENPSDNYVKQFEQIPEKGTLAKSE
ncbi:MAG: hypothetical protein ACK5LL_12310 [Suipraeoptans sp.]